MNCQLNIYARQFYSNDRHSCIYAMIGIFQSYQDKIAQFISEPDRGIYKAINQGLKLATGDISEIFNFDYFYNKNNIISQVIDEF